MLGKNETVCFFRLRAAPKVLKEMIFLRLACSNVEMKRTFHFSKKKTSSKSTFKSKVFEEGFILKSRKKTCQASIKSGKNKGNKCGCIVRGESKFCGKHKNYKKNNKVI